MSRLRDSGIVIFQVANDTVYFISSGFYIKNFNSELTFMKIFTNES